MQVYTYLSPNGQVSLIALLNQEEREKFSDVNVAVQGSLREGLTIRDRALQRSRAENVGYYRINDAMKKHEGRLTLHRSFIGFQVSFTSQRIELQVAVDTNYLLTQPLKQHSFVRQENPATQVRGVTRSWNAEKFIKVANVDVPRACVSSSPLLLTAPQTDVAAITAAAAVLNRALAADPNLDLTIVDRKLRVSWSPV